jgi:hypothetical protein
MLVVYSQLVSKIEQQGKQFETSVISPVYTSFNTLEESFRILTEGLGEVTIFQKPGQTGQVLSTRIGPYDLWEARELEHKAKERFIRGVLMHMKKSPCVVFRWLPAVPAHNRRA